MKSILSVLILIVSLTSFSQTTTRYESKLVQNGKCFEIMIPSELKIQRETNEEIYFSKNAAFDTPNGFMISYEFNPDQTLEDFINSELEKSKIEESVKLSYAKVNIANHPFVEVNFRMVDDFQILEGIGQLYVTKIGDYLVVMGELKTTTSPQVICAMAPEVMKTFKFIDTSKENELYPHTFLNSEFESNLMDIDIYFSVLEESDLWFETEGIPNLLNQFVFYDESGRVDIFSMGSINAGDTLNSLHKGLKTIYPDLAQVSAGVESQFQGSECFFTSYSLRNAMEKNGAQLTKAYTVDFNEELLVLVVYAYPQVSTEFLDEYQAFVSSLWSYEGYDEENFEWTEEQE